MRWFGHTMRMENKIATKKYTEKVNKKCHRERWKKWMDNERG